MTTAIATTFQGRRLKLIRTKKGGRWAPPYGTFEPGDYCGPVERLGGLPAVYFLKPNARDEDAPKEAHGMQYIESPPHTFLEQLDGSLAIVQPISDLKAGGESDGWAGYLDPGSKWRQTNA